MMQSARPGWVKPNAPTKLSRLAEKLREDIAVEKRKTERLEWDLQSLRRAAIVGSWEITEELFSDVTLKALEKRLTGQTEDRKFEG